MIIYNSLTRKLETFKPHLSGKVSIYVCGITPYDTTHLGHAFTYISFDALIRFLTFKGFNLSYTQNVTDINDRDRDILQRAQEKGITWQHLSKYWTKKFLEDMKALNWTAPINYLYASKNLVAMIRMIKSLLKKGFAYQVNGSVYIDVGKFKNFGSLSRLNKNQMLKKALEFEEDIKDPQKKNPLDFTLWKASQPNQPTHIPSFKSPWGRGRPGWHIECSAMSVSSLGKQIDIHGGGKDLIFPHHEAEIIQSEGAAGKIPFVKYWMHTGTVYYKGVKMSKSKGNLVMVSDLLKKYSANAIRWLLLSHHYRSDWEFKEDELKKAQKNVDKLQKSIAQGLDYQWNKILSQDLNTPKVLNFLLQNPDKKIYEILGFKL